MIPIEAYSGAGRTADITVNIEDVIDIMHKELPIPSATTSTDH
jgi:hypothetical protein